MPFCMYRLYIHPRLSFLENSPTTSLKIVKNSGFASCFISFWTDPSLVILTKVEVKVNLEVKQNRGKVGKGLSCLNKGNNF